MTNEIVQPVTPGGEPDDDNGGAAGTLETPAGTAPPATQTPPALPDEAYKGMQRNLEREKARVRELEAQLQQVASTPTSENDAKIVSALLTEIAQSNPERANQLATAYQGYRLAAENQQLRNRQANEEQERIYREAQERNTRELRETARAFGADPDSPLIDYGDADNESIAERLARVRVSATAAAANAQVVTPPDRSQAAGTTHNTQPGSPPAPPSANRNVVTDEMLQAANDKYARTYHTMNGEARAAAEAELRDLTDRYAAQVFA